MYAIVQHSAFGYKGDSVFQQALESRSVVSRSQIAEIRKVGGLMFDTYMEAEDFCDDAMYPETLNDLIPQAKGTFAAYQIDGLAVYIPFRMDGTDD